MKVEIRKARLDKDKDQLEFLLKSLKEDHRSWYVNEVEEMFEGDSTIWLMEVDDKPIGFADLGRYEGREIFNMLFILPAYRNRGLGTRLASYVIQHSKNDVVYGYVHHANVPALKILMKLGFRVDDDGGEFIRYVLRKSGK